MTEPVISKKDALLACQAAGLDPSKPLDQQLGDSEPASVTKDEVQGWIKEAFEEAKKPAEPQSLHAAQTRQGQAMLKHMKAGGIGPFGWEKDKDDGSTAA